MLFRSAVARALGHTPFPAASALPGTVRAAEDLLADTGLAPKLRRLLADQLDDLRRALVHRG